MGVSCHAIASKRAAISADACGLIDRRAVIAAGLSAVLFAPRCARAATMIDSAGRAALCANDRETSESEEFSLGA